jgi:hypothetical protein
MKLVRATRLRYWCTYRKFISAQTPQYVYNALQELKFTHPHICIFPNIHTCSAYYLNHRPIDDIASTDGTTHTWGTFI